MSKKFTSVLLAATALLLSLTTQAQEPVRKQVGQAPMFKVVELRKGQPTASQAKASFSKKQTVVKPAAKVEKTGRVRIPMQAPRQVLRPYAFACQQTSLPLFRLPGEEITDEHGIITSPAEGTRKVYARSGQQLVNDEMMSVSEQRGTMQIVWCADNTVYIRNLLASYPTGAWVKGTFADGVVTVKTRQPIYYNASAEVTYSVGWVMYEEGIGGYSSYDDYSDVITFAVSDDQQTLTLQGSSQSVFIGLLWDDDNAFGWCGDWETVLTYEKDFEPMQPTTVTPLLGMTTEQWYVKGHTIVAEERQIVKGSVAVGLADDKIFVKGIFADYADGWMMGTISDGTVTFDGLQVQAENVYAVGSQDGDLVPFTMSYDADQKVLTAQCQLLANTSTTDIASLFTYSDLTIQLADPFAPIETLPYVNTLDDMDDWEWFTVVDANEDGSTWHWYSDGQASYKYNDANNADDWLFTPAFRLEAGKTYVFSLDANVSSSAYAETFEVKMGGAPTAEAMTADVVAGTSIDSEMPVAFANKTITVAETGTYYFGIHVTSPADQSSLRIDNVTVDERILTAPVAVTDLAVTPASDKAAATITFTAPTMTIGGADLTAITKAEILRDGEVIATLTDVKPGEAQSYVDDDESLASGIYSYQVLCYTADGKGDLSEAVKARLTVVFSVPYYGDFTDVDNNPYNEFIVLDANGDGFTFEDDATKAQYSYSSDNQADDYLVSPALHLEAGQNYAITVDVGSGGYPEEFEVVVGQEPTAAGLTTKVLENCGVELEDFKVYEGVFTPETTGTYYVAVHCTSPADLYLFWVNRLNIEFGPADDAPAAATLTVTPGAEGAKSATLDIILPTKTVADGSLASISRVDIYRDGNQVGSMENQTPGATVQYVDQADDLTDGTHAYMAVCYNEAGIGKKSEQVSAYIGMDTPKGVEMMTAADLFSSVKLDWTAVSTEGANGGYVNPAAVSYKVWTCEPNTTFVMDFEPTVTTEPGVTTATLDYDTNEGEQGYQGWVVTAQNEVGESYMGDSYLATLVVGKAYDLPFQEGFAGGTTHYYWDSNAMAMQYAMATDGDGYAFALTSEKENTEIFLSSGKLNINDAENPTLIFDAAGFGVSSLQVIGQVNGNGEVAELGTYTVNDQGYKTVKIALNDLKSEGGYAQFAIMATITNPTVQDLWTGETTFGDALVLDNIRVIDQYQNNLSISVVGPDSLELGKSTGIITTVANWGEKEATDFKVTIKAGANTIAEQTVSTPLAPYTSTTLTTMLATTVFDEAGDLTISAEVAYAADEYAADNSAETVVVLTEPNVPRPASVAADDRGSEGVEVSWLAPQTNAQAVEGFEDGLGGWTANDADQDGFSWTYSKYGETELYMSTKNGLGCIFSESYSNTALKALEPDNWLVSPKANLGGSFTFYAKGQDASFCSEHFAVYVSTTSATDPAAFTQVLDEQVATDEFVEYSADLSAYEGQQGYIAIRHYNTSDQFVLVVDDISYSPTCTGYNVYYEGTLVATVEDGATTFTVAADKIHGGKLQFAVTAVYGNGQESKPVVTTIEYTNDIREIVSSDQPVDVYSVDGKLLRRQTRSLEGLKGVFVVNGQKVMVKE